MDKEEITIEIDEATGEMLVDVKGIKGPLCVSEVEKLLGDLAMKLEETRTDEYYQDSQVRVSRTAETRISKKGE